MNWLIVFLVAFYIGWVAAHKEVAMECKAHGKFYVETVVFQCSAKEE